MRNRENGSIELVVLGLLAALIAVLAFPLVSSITAGDDSEFAQYTNAQTQQFVSDRAYLNK